MSSIQKTETAQVNASEEMVKCEATEKGQMRVITPRINLYETQEGWLLVAALPKVDRDQVKLNTEGTTLELTAIRDTEGVKEQFRRALRFPKETRWGDLKAHWEGDLLHIELKRAEPERRMITIA